MVENISFILGSDTDFNIDVLISQNPASDINLRINEALFNQYFTLESTTEVGYIKVIKIRIPSTILPFNGQEYVNYSLIFDYEGVEQAILKGILQERN